MGKEKKLKKIMVLDVIEDKATKIGNSSHIILPVTWTGKRVMVIKLER